MTTIALALSTVLSVMGLWFYFFWLWRDYRTDMLRQRLFGLRDQLFDLAADGQVSFRHPAYGLLRTTLNGFIRFAHRLRFFAVIGLVLGTHKEEVMEVAKEEFLTRWQKASAGLSPHQHRALVEVLVAMNIAVAKHVIATSLFLVVSIVPVLGILFLEVLRRKITGRLRRILRGIANPLDTHALALGLDS